MKDVKVYAQNLRSYNMGLDQGRWITLGIEELRNRNYKES